MRRPRLRNFLIATLLAVALGVFERVLGGSGAADAEAQQSAAGRGIMLVRSLCDELVYFPPGNRVRARYRPRSHGGD